MDNKKIAIVHKHYLGDNFVMPTYLSEDGVKTIYQRILSGDPWGYKNHKAYAEYNNYQFIEDREPWYDSKPPDWAIWQAALRVLKDPNIDVDWIHFSVNDMVYVDFDKRLEDYIINAPKDAFMATGIYNAKLRWRIINTRTNKWDTEFYKDPYDCIIMSGWSHFIRKCPEAIKFVEMLDNDQRFRDVPILYNHAFTGDGYLSIWYNDYPEYRKNWHIYSSHDHTRIPNNITNNNWKNSWCLKPYEEKKCLMVFATCCVDYKDTLQTLEEYTNKMLNENNSITKI